MTKTLFKRCTIAAFVCAACLFAAGCDNPFSPSPTPPQGPGTQPINPPSTQNPAGSSSSSGGSFSSGGSTSSTAAPVSPGSATVQKSASPNPGPKEPVNNLTITLKSIEFRGSAGASRYGIVPSDITVHRMNQTFEKKLSVQVPERLYKTKNSFINGAEAQKEVIETVTKQLKAWLNAKNLGTCELTHANADTEPQALDTATNCKADGDGTVYVMMPNAPMTVQTYAMLKAVIPAADAKSVKKSGENTRYVVPTNAAIGQYVVIQGENTKTKDELKALIQPAVKDLLGTEIGSGKYIVFKANTATPPAADLANEADDTAYKAGLEGTEANPKYFFVGKKETPKKVKLTIQSIASSYKVKINNAETTYQPISTIEVEADKESDNSTGISDATTDAEISKVLAIKVAAITNFDKYRFFLVQHPGSEYTTDASTDNDSKQLTIAAAGTAKLGPTATATDVTLRDGMTIYAGKKS